MKKVIVIISCMVMAMQLSAEHSWASCDKPRARSTEKSFKTTFDPEWERWDERCGCDDDSSELVNDV